jgi:signal transduction histidine kinase
LSDNGVGFDPSAIDGSSHYGLKGMKERIHKLGGKFTVKSAPGKGTEIEISVPFEQA